MEHPGQRPRRPLEHSRVITRPAVNLTLIFCRSVRAVAAEKQRERKLRDDPLVVVESPQLVICKRCGASIKLSLKSAYDPFHWHRHRERCLKRPDAVVRGLKDVNTTDKDGKVRAGCYPRACLS